MKIAFNLISCGLGNNGGSLTIIKSANALVDLGHEVYIVDSMSNQCTWEKLKAEYINVNTDITAIHSQVDVVVCTGFKTLKAIRSFWPKMSGNRVFHWIRGWETWNYPEEELISMLSDDYIYPTIKMVNGAQLQRKLYSLGIESHIIRPGYDFDELFPDNILSPVQTISKTIGYVFLGGIYNRGDKRKAKRTEWIFKTKTELEKRGQKIMLQMFGTGELSPEAKIYMNSYTKNPQRLTKNIFFNGVDIWLAPTELEGLHMPPAEAMLTECPVIGTNAELSGMEDYLINQETGFVADNTLESFIACTEALVKNKRLRQQLGKAARQKILSLGDRKQNMQKMVELFDQRN